MSTTMKWVFCFTVHILLSVISTTNAVDTEYVVGTGIADITGPAAEINMMGYANPGQTTRGIHLRQFSRAFIFNDKDKNRVLFINIDACMFSQGIKLEIIKQLRQKYGDMYNERNVCITGTHTHSGPGGFHQYLLFDLTSLGFVRETFDSLIEGILLSVDRAHNNTRPANLFVNFGELLDSNINRSPSAYLFNPPEERAKYKYDTDKNMTVLKIVDDTGKPMGMISWFAVHCTSMNNTNRLISSDNKGYAALLFEEGMNGRLPSGWHDPGVFVGAFSQSNEGDVSPNTKGPHCLDTGLPCAINTSTCNGRNELCIAFGPGKDMVDSTNIIATNQYRKAKELFDSATLRLTGSVDFRHTYTDMTQQVVAQGNKTCKPAMGYSFAAGTTDGPGAFDFTQGTTSTSPVWNFVSGLLKKPSEETKACHHPKPILLDTGEIDFPYLWQPSIVDTQILKIGQLFIIAVPAEFTTMSGRRTRDAVTQTLKASGFVGEPIPVIAGLSNDYADYVTTFEEYQDQRYEGGSTIYGPHTLEAFIQVYTNLTKAMATGSPVSPGPDPPNLISKQLSFVIPVILDRHPSNKKFGDNILQPRSSYKQGETVVTKFVGANPRNNRKLESTFLTVFYVDESRKVPVLNDYDWETTFEWESAGAFESTITITWNITAAQRPGTYSIEYYGNSRSLTGTISDFTGSTTPFKVVAADVPQPETSSNTDSANILGTLQKLKIEKMKAKVVKNKKNFIQKETAGMLSTVLKNKQNKVKR